LIIPPTPHRWAFPTLSSRGGDANSLDTGADLRSVNEALAYATHPALRHGLLTALSTAAAAFSRHPINGPYLVLDAGF
jgi:hypothetical protein